MISKVKAKYWRTTHKYGIRLPKTAKEALQLDKMNGNDYWEKVIKKEMSKVWVAYEPNEKRGVKPNGENYWELLLVYVDDCLAVSHDLESTMLKIGEIYELKDDEFGTPESYLGAGIEKFMLPDGTKAW
ncbi:hypothetical protein ACHAWX_001521, partial [Stephanocyclus meneghinianus]